MSGCDRIRVAEDINKWWAIANMVVSPHFP